MLLERSAVGLELIKDSQGFVNLGAHGFVVVQQQDELLVVHFEEHAGNFARQLGFGAIKRYKRWSQWGENNTYAAILM